MKTQVCQIYLGYEVNGSSSVNVEVVFEEEFHTNKMYVLLFFVFVIPESGKNQCILRG